jgi:CNP1-like family protein
LTRLRGLSTIALIAAATACSQPASPRGEDLDGKSWDAQKALLPAYPKQGNLIPFYVGPATPFAFFVDPASVSVGPDRAVRYTLIARSPSAAVNVSYEGIRCETYERKVYAFGKSDGTWAQARRSDWIPITPAPANPYAALADDFFCSARGGVQSAEEAVAALARGNQPR